MRLRSARFAAVTTAVGCVIGSALLSSAPADAGTAYGTQVVSAVPLGTTPGAQPGLKPNTTLGINDGEVLDYASVGSRVYAVGSFTTVNGVARRGIIAMDGPGYGLVSGFAPTVDGTVDSVAAGPTAGTIVIGGEFTTVNGVARSYLAVLDASTGALVPGFAPPVINKSVNAVAVVQGQIIAGGNFTKVGTTVRNGIASFSTTGALTPFVANAFTVNHSWTATSGGQKGPVGVQDFRATPDGKQLVVIGNFKYADGLLRNQLAILSLAGSTSVVRTDWATSGYAPACNSAQFDQTVRGLDISPDGTWFVVAANGGYNGTLCDGVARFELTRTGADVPATWSNLAGGDSAYSAAITGSVVYAGGHFRWSSNPDAVDWAGPGSVARPGLEALDARTGIPVAWNPGRNPRGVGARALYAAPDGLWVGMDTTWIGNGVTKPADSRTYYRPRVVFFPLAGGTTLASEGVATLPATVVVGASSTTLGAPANTVSSYTFTGTSATATATGVPSTDGGAFDPVLVRGSTVIGNQLFYGKNDNTFAVRTIAADGSLGAERLVDPYHDPYWSTIQTGSGQTYVSDYPDWYHNISSITAMWYDNGQLYYTLAGDRSLYRQAFSPDSGVLAPHPVVVPGVTMPSVSVAGSAPMSIKGAFLTGGTLYWILPTGELQAVPWNAGVPAVSAATTVSGPAKDGVNWAGYTYEKDQFVYLAPSSSATPTVR